MSNEAQERTCRCCDRQYAYPVKKSLATRFYCATCADLAEETRAMFERYNKRLRKLSREVEKLRGQLARRGET